MIRLPSLKRAFTKNSPKSALFVKQCTRSIPFSSTSTTLNNTPSTFNKKFHDAMVKRNVPGRKRRLPTQILMKKVDTILNEDTGNIHPKDLSYECEYLLKECTKLNSAKGAQSAVKLLHRLLEEKKWANDFFLEAKRKDSGSGRHQFFVTHAFFHSAMFAQAKRKDGAQRIQEIIDLMAKEDEYDIKRKKDFDGCGSSGDVEGWIDKREKRLSCRPTTSSFNILLNTLANETHKNAKTAKRAETVLDDMILRQREKQWHTKPNTQSYEAVIHAYEHSCTFQGGDCAKRVFYRMKTAHEADLEAYRKNSLSGADYNFEDHSKNYRQIVVLGKKTVMGVINAYLNSNTKRSANLAEGFLLSCLAKDGDKQASINHMILDEHHFNSVIKGYSQTIRKLHCPKARFEAADSAERLLRLMKTLSQIDDASVINLHHLAPSTETYSLAMNVWAQSDVEESAARTLALFEELVESTEISPKHSSCHCLMTAFARSFPSNPNSAQQTEEVIAKMLNLREIGINNVSLQPSELTYSVAINAWARSKNTLNKHGVHKATNARRILDIMTGDQDFRAPIHAFTSVLSACAFKGGTSTGIEESSERDVLEIAWKTYDEVVAGDVNVVADSYFFCAMIKVLRSHLPKTSPKRMQFIGRVYADAKEAQCASPKVVKELRASCDADELRLLLGDE